MSNPTPSTPFILPAVGPPNLANGDSGAGGQNDWASYQMMRPYLRRLLQTDFSPLFYGTVMDSTAINAAILDAALAGGGVVHIPAGVWTVNATLTWASNVQLVRNGIGITILRAGNGLNSDVINGGGANVALINLAAAPGTGSNGGLTACGIRDLTIDGNKAGHRHHK